MAINELGRAFFPEAKKVVRLDDYKQLKSRGGERRKKLMLSMEFTEDNIVRMPGWVNDAYGLLLNDGAHAARVVFSKGTEMEGMTMEVYASSDSKHRAFAPLTGCLLKGITLEKTGLEEKAKFTLSWQCYTQDPLELHDWCQIHYSREFTIVYSQGQITLDFSGVEGEDEENKNTMDASRDKEFRSPGTKADRQGVAKADKPPVAVAAAAAKKKEPAKKSTKALDF